MPVLAAIDIGSNSCRLAIASVEQHRLHTLHEDREVTRLGESVFESGEISPESMANTIKALKRFHKAVQAHAVDQVRVVATSATRDARNAEAFKAWVKSATGWNLEVISGLEEGRLIHLGVVSHEPGARARVLLIDLGGGSCEITLSEGGRIQEMVSLPLGAVRLQQEFLTRNDPPTPSDIGRLRQFIERELEQIEARMMPDGKPIEVDHVLATSGTAAALAEAANSLPAEGAHEKHPIEKKVRGDSARKEEASPLLEADAASIHRLAERLIRMNNEQRAIVKGIGPRRAEIIIGGALVYSMLFEKAGLQGFRYSPLGLRDGVLAQMLGESDSRASVHRTMEAERTEGVLAVCKRYGVDPRSAEPVREYVEQLFDQLLNVHELPPEYKLWLSSAAMMREVGKYMNHQGHHRHTQYIIANSEIFGFTPAQRATVAAIARYLGKSRPEPLDRPMRMVPVEEHGHVNRAVVLLRLANALHLARTGGGPVSGQKNASRLKLRTICFPKRVVLELKPSRGNAELEAWSLRKEASYFREIFRRELFVEVA